MGRTLRFGKVKTLLTFVTTIAHQIIFSLNGSSSWQGKKLASCNPYLFKVQKLFKDFVLSTHGKAFVPASGTDEKINLALEFS